MLSELEVATQEEKKIFCDPRMDIYAIGKSDFFQICSDLQILTSKELFQSSLCSTVFLKLTDDLLLDDYTFNRNIFLKESATFLGEVERAVELSLVTKERFYKLLDAVRSNSQELTPNKKLMVRFLVQYKMLVHTYHSLMLIDRKDMRQLANVESNDVIAKIVQDNIT